MKKMQIRPIAVLLILTLFLSTISLGATADTIITDGPIDTFPGFGGNAGEIVTPLDMNISSYIYITLKTSATVMYAPHPNESASTGYTVSPGMEIHTFGRVYDYFYIGWYVGTKIMYGYIPMSAVNIPSSYNWVSFDIYRPATCNSTTPVLSGAGTTSTFIQIGEIYANESPLMVLGQYTNVYNNKIYYYVEYQTSDLKVKRGWVDESLDSVSPQYNYCYTTYESGDIYCLINQLSGLAMTWDTATNSIKQKTPDGSLYQFFICEPISYESSPYGYWRLVSLADPTMAVCLNSTGWSEGLTLKMTKKAEPDKHQEFVLIPNRDFATNSCYTTIKTRATGEYRALEVSGASTANNANIVQSVADSAEHQKWTALKVADPWENTFGQYSGGTTPMNRVVHYDHALSDYISFSAVQECVERWNNMYDFNLGLVYEGNPYDSNRLAVIRPYDLPDGTVGQCVSEYRDGTTLIVRTNNSSNYVDSQWFSTTIYIDIEAILNGRNPENYEVIDELQSVICHELGHSLKQSHTFLSLQNNSQNLRRWQTVAMPKTIMSQTYTIRNTSTPVAIDQYRLIDKWF